MYIYHEFKQDNNKKELYTLYMRKSGSRKTKKEAFSKKWVGQFDSRFIPTVALLEFKYNYSFNQKRAFFSLSLSLSFFLQVIMATTEKPFDRAALEQLCTKRFFFAPAFAIYGGKVVVTHSISFNIKHNVIYI